MVWVLCSRMQVPYRDCIALCEYIEPLVRPSWPPQSQGQEGVVTIEPVTHDPLGIALCYYWIESDCMAVECIHLWGD